MSERTAAMATCSGRLGNATEMLSKKAARKIAIESGSS
jgi:hypothetical protein